MSVIAVSTVSHFINTSLIVADSNRFAICCIALKELSLYISIGA